ncbi:MAG TPA: 3-mercaptopyruvate sulfurtransferase [Rhizomicrobium sp.]|nr:3-mercaptopyruvate sulfurtransferase [Rhizomicrobium sp.]
MTYAHPEALVSTEWLAANLHRSDLRILDGSFTLPGVNPSGPALYRQRHIPGAIFFDIDGIRDEHNPLPHMLPDEKTFAAIMGRLGVGDTHKIVVYDQLGFISAPRIWFSLTVFGHKNVALLNGGMPKWLAERRPVTAEIPHHPPANFTARLDRTRLRDKAAMLANLKTRREQVIDARSAGRFAGTAPEPREGLRGGHIPGSLSLPADQLMAKDREVLPADELAAKFRAAGLDPARPVAASCGSGVTASALALGLHLIGWQDAAVYDGSWSEWGMPGDTPVETGSGPTR